MLETHIQVEARAVTIAQAALACAGIWLVLGTLFALAFVTVGVGRVDPKARGASFGFRLLIFPATVVLWPLLLLRWIRGGGEPLERNAHRRAAGERRE